MYSSAVSSLTARSPSPLSSAAPPPKRQHADKKEASENAKKLTHATKDRPRRKVRLPSRKLRKESVVKLDPPAIPIFPKELMMESEGRVGPDLPPLPPPPPPPESAQPQTSPTLLNSVLIGNCSNSASQKSALSPKYVKRGSISPRNKSPFQKQGSFSKVSASSPSVSSQGIPAANISIETTDPNKAITASFAEHHKRLRENSASKSNSRVLPMARGGDVFSTNRRVYEYKPPAEKTTIAKTFSTPRSNGSSSLWEGNSSHKSQDVQSISPRHPKTHRFSNFQSNLSEGPPCPSSLQSYAEVGVKTGSPNVRESISASGLEVKDDLETAKDLSDDYFQTVPLLPDISPPDDSRQPLPTPEVQNSADTKPKTTPKVASHNPIGYHSLRTRNWTEEWQQRSNFLDDKMSEPLPLLIQTKATENDKETPTTEHASKDSSSSSIASIPDYPPPMVPDYPMLPDELEGSEAFEIELSEVSSSGTKTPSPRRPPALKTKETLNQEQTTSTLSGLISSPPSKKSINPESSPLAFSHFPILPSVSLSPVSSLKSLPNLRADTEAKSADNSTKLHGVHRATHVHIPNICKQSKDSPLHLPEVEDYLMKSTTVPNFETASSSFPVIHPKLSTIRSRDNPNFGKRIDSSTTSPALRSMMNQHHKVKVIQESVPISPDLKFTRVAKKTWKKPNPLRDDDLSSSSSTGNVVQDIGLDPELIDHRMRSMQYFHSSDSIPQNDKHLQLQKLSPLAENGASMPIVGSSVEDKPPHVLSSSSDRGSEKQVENWRERLPSHVRTSEEHKLKVTRQLKHGRLNSFQEDVKRITQISSVPDSNVLDTKQEKWSTEEVGQWLDLVGLGSFKQAFKKNNITGFILLHMDTKLFAELGIEGHKMREIFLSKIYELNKPSSNVGGTEESLQSSVDIYKNKDWQKMKAAVNALKSPIRNGSVKLEPLLTEELLHTRSLSTPNVPDSAEEDVKLGMESHFHYQSPIPLTTDQTHFGSISGSVHKFRDIREHESPYSRPRRAGILNMEEIHSRDSHSLQSTSRTNASNLGKSMISQWISELPDHGTHSDTEPAMPPDSNLKEDISSTSSKACVYPCFIPSCPPPMLLPSQQVDQPRTTLSGSRKLEGQVDSPNHLSTSQVHASTPQKVPPLILARSPSDERSLTSPRSFSVSLPESTLVKVYMNQVQEGSLYKSFMANSLTTVEDVVAQALIKANMSDQDPSNYSIMEISSESRKFLERFHTVVDSMNRHAHDKNYRLELRYKEGLNTSKTTTPSVSNVARVETESPRKKPASEQEVTQAHIQQLEKSNSELSKDLDYLKLELLNHQEFKGRLSWLQKEHAMLEKKYDDEQSSHKNTVQHLQEQLDNTALIRRKIEEHLLVLKATEAEDAGPASMLEQIQEKYIREVSSLTSEVRVKDRSLRELRKKRAELEDEMSSLQEKMKMADEASNELVQCNMQVHSSEQDCASKEDVIHKTTAEKEQTKQLAGQNATLQKTLQTLELNAKQQQNISSHTVKELGQRLDQLALESAQKDQQARTLRKEVDRLFHEKNMKDALIASLETDLASYKMFQTHTSSESTHMQNLQKSISGHEMAMSSLNKEFKKQNEELLVSQQDMVKLKILLDKKEEQLSLMTSANRTDSDKQRSSLYSTLTHNGPHSLISARHSLITAHFMRPPRHEGDREGLTMKARVGIKVATSPGDIRGCVIVKADEHVQTVGLLPGDRVLEVNDSDVTTKSTREMGELLQRHFLSSEGLKLVVARPLISKGGEDNTNSSANMVERYRNLSSSLSVRLEAQNAEVDHWRQECNGLKSEILKYSTSKKEKDTETKYLQSTIQALKRQLENAERSVKLLKDTMDELDGSVGKNAYQQLLEMMENALKERDKEVNTLKDAEKTRIAELKKMKKDKDRAVKIMRQYVVNTEDLKNIVPLYKTNESLTKFTRGQMVTTIHALEEDLAHHKAYLDQVLTVVIDQNPQLLSMISEAQKIRDKMDDDNWC